MRILAMLCWMIGMALPTLGQDAITVDATGNVGVGTSTPGPNLNLTLPVNNNSIRGSKGSRDLFMSILATCQLNGVKPFEYLNALQRHIPEVHHDPGA